MTAKTKPQWLDYPHEECPVCGGSVQILTACPQDKFPRDAEDDSIAEPPRPWAWCGDVWRCGEGHQGEIYCDSETPIQLEGGE